MNLTFQGERTFNMDYISVSEASEKWDVTPRQVQRLLAADRILCAKKYGRLWMIPKDAEKPIDPRREKRENSLSLTQIIVSTTVPMPRDNPDAIMDSVNDPRLQLHYEGELAYLRGDFEKTMRCFNATEGDDAARLRACPVAIAAAISLGDYRAYSEIEKSLKRWAQAEKGSHIAAIAELALATATVSVIAPNMAPAWLIEGDFSALPAQAKTDALYLRAKHFQCLANYGVMLAVAQTALALSVAEEGITLPEIYLRVSCAIAFYSLERVDEARRFLLEAMRICLPHGFITPFAESITALGGLVEQCLEEVYPNHYDAVIRQWKRSWKNWIYFHNNFTKDNITLMLTLREYHIALQVARRVPYAKIANQYHVSVGRLKNIMLGIYGKLLVSGRDELLKYIF